MDLRNLTAVLNMSNLTVVMDQESQNPMDVPSQWIKDFRFATEGVAQLVVGLVGLVGNVLSIGVLHRRDMDLKPVFRQILITLITFDLFCIVCNLLLFSLPKLSEDYNSMIFPYMVPYVLPIAQIVLTGSIYSTLAVAIERYMSVCHPHHTASSCSGLVSVVALVLFSVGFNVCRFLEFETTYEVVEHEVWNPERNATEVVNLTMAVASTTPMRRDRVYSQITMIVMLTVCGIIPLVVLLVLNSRIYKAIQMRTQRLLSMSSKQRRDFDVAAVLVGIILVFIVCHSFKFFVNCYEAYIMYFDMNLETAWVDWMDAVVSFSHLLATVNSSINFVIYCYKDEKFRTSLVRMLCSEPGQALPCTTTVI